MCCILLVFAFMWASCPYVGFIPFMFFILGFSKYVLYFVGFCLYMGFMLLCGPYAFREFNNCSGLYALLCCIWLNTFLGSNWCN